jgi:hypothetical protein
MTSRAVRADMGFPFKPVFSRAFPAGVRFFESVDKYYEFDTIPSTFKIS